MPFSCSHYSTKTYDRGEVITHVPHSTIIRPAYILGTDLAACEEGLRRAVFWTSVFLTNGRTLVFHLNAKQAPSWKREGVFLDTSHLFFLLRRYPMLS